MKMKITRHANLIPYYWMAERKYTFQGNPGSELELKEAMAGMIYKDLFEKEPPTMWTGKEHPDWEFYKKFVEMLVVSE